MKPLVRRFGTYAVLAVVVGTPAAVRADNTDDCAASYESAQRLRSSGKLRSALDAAITCARVCPAVFKKECTEWLGPLRDAIPSLSVRVLGPDGCDVADARVTMDDPSAIGAPAVSGRADGRAFDVDPGPHELIVRLANGAERKLPVVVAQGNRDRAVAVSFAEAGAVCGSPRPGRVVAPPRAHRDVPLVTWVLGGVGVVALGVSGAFGISGLSKMSDLSGCRPRCAHDEADSMRSAFVVADIGLAVGVVSLAAATVFYLAAPSRAASSAHSGTTLLSF